MNTIHLSDQQIQDYVDGIIGPDFSTVAAHIEECPYCRAAVVQYQVLCDGLKDDSGFELPVNFASSVITGLEQRVDISVSPVTTVSEKSNNDSDIWYSAVLFGSIGMVVAMTLYFVGFSRFITFATSLLQTEFGIVDKLIAPISSLLERFNIQPELALFSILTLLAIGAIDSILKNIHHRGTAMFCA